MAKWPQTYPMTSLQISINGYWPKISDHKKKDLTKIEKLLEETMMRTHIYERHFGHGFEGKDVHSQTFVKKQTYVLIREEYDQPKKEENKSPLGFKCIVGMFDTSFIFLICWA